MSLKQFLFFPTFALNRHVVYRSKETISRRQKQLATLETQYHAPVGEIPHLTNRLRALKTEHREAIGKHSAMFSSRLYLLFTNMIILTYSIISSYHIRHESLSPYWRLILNLQTFKALPA